MTDYSDLPVQWRESLEAFDRKQACAEAYWREVGKTLTVEQRAMLDGYPRLQRAFGLAE